MNNFRFTSAPMSVIRSFRSIKSLMPNCLPCGASKILVLTTCWRRLFQAAMAACFSWRSVLGGVVDHEFFKFLDKRYRTTSDLLYDVFRVLLLKQFLGGGIFHKILARFVELPGLLPLLRGLDSHGLRLILHVLGDLFSETRQDLLSLTG